MHSEKPPADIAPLAEAIAALLRLGLRESPNLRDSMSALGRWLIEEASASETREEAPSTWREPAAMVAPPQHSGSTATSVCPKSSGDVVRVPPPVVTQPAALRLGDAAVEVFVAPVAGVVMPRSFEPATAPSSPAPPRVAASTPDLAKVAAKVRVKARACRLRREAMLSTLAPAVRLQFTEEWQSICNGPLRSDDSARWISGGDHTSDGGALLELIERNYHALGDAAACVLAADDPAVGATGPERSRAFQLLATTTSALRAALRPVSSVEDEDQFAAHHWLRVATREREIFVPDHMRAEDPADPHCADSVREQIATLQRVFELRRESARVVKDQLGKIGYEAKRLLRAEDDELHPHWRKIAGACEALQAVGVSVDDRRIVRLLHPLVVERCPLDLAAAEPLSGLLRAVRDRGRRQDDDAASAQVVADQPEESWSDDVLRVRELIRGRRVVLIGGIRNQQAADLMVDAFELSEVEWVRLEQHGRSEAMRGPIRRRDTALVIVLIKFSGHAHAADARAIGAAEDRPVVLVERGYNPEQLARAILEQASDRLGDPKRQAS